MSYKVDTLLKRAEVYERLAVFGDRKSFLQSLSQKQSQDQYLDSLVGSINKLIRELAPEDPSNPKNEIHDLQKEYVAKRIDDYIMPELYRIHNSFSPGQGRDPYAPEESNPTDFKIEQAVSAFEKAFPRQAPQCPNFLKLKNLP